MTRRRRLLLAGAVAAVTLVVFAPALRGGWLLDDYYLIVGDPAVHSFAHAGRWLTSDFWHVLDQTGVTSRLHYWRPLVTASYAADWQLGDGGALQFHLTNLLLAAAVAVLAFGALRRWTGAVVPAFVAALVWAVHPTKAENIAWISGRTDVICVLGVLLAAAGIARRLRRERGGLALEAVGTAIAYLAKEQAVVLPVFAAIEVWAHAGRPGLDRATVRRAIAGALPQAAIAVVYTIAHVVLMPVRSPRTLGLADHASAVLETFGRAFALTFAPHQLSIQHALIRAHDGSLAYATPYIVLGAVGLVGAVAIAVLARRRWPAVTIAIACYLVTFLPTSNLALTDQQTLISERFLYLPTLGLALALAALLAALPAAWLRRGYLIAGACTVALAAQALSRSADFGDERAFWQRELRLHPDSGAALAFVLEDEMSRHVVERLDEVAAHAASRVEFAASAAELLAASVPDHEVATLRAIDDFCRALIAHEPTARLDAWGVEIAVGNDAATTTALAAVTWRLDAVRADIASRLGEPEAARRAAAAARAACDGCPAATDAAAIVEARAGSYDAALALVAASSPLRARIETARAASARATATHGAAQLQARAEAYAALGQWEAAYRVLAPRFGEITMLSRAGAGFAKIAFRAGEIMDAVDALASAVPAAEIRPTLERWAAEAGWLGATSAAGPSSP